MQESRDAQQLKYGVMVLVRVFILLHGATRPLAAACTVATRYSCVRRQSELHPGYEGLFKCIKVLILMCIM